MGQGLLAGGIMVQPVETVSHDLHKPNGRMVTQPQIPCRESGSVRISLKLHPYLPPLPQGPAPGSWMRPSSPT